MLSKKYYTIITNSFILTISYVVYRLIAKWIQWLSKEYQGWSIFDIVSVIIAFIIGLTCFIILLKFHYKDKKKKDNQDK